MNETARASVAEGTTIVDPRAVPRLREGAWYTHRRLRYLAVLLVAFGIWWLLAAVHAFAAFALPSPVDVYHGFITLVTTGYQSTTLQKDLLSSIYRIGVAFAGAILIGVIVGIGMSESRLVFQIIDPFLQFLRPIPPLAYVPLFVLWFGIGELPKILLILLATAPVMIINTLSGVQSVPPPWIEVARSLGASRGQILLRVILPASLPEIFTGMRVGIGIAWSTVVAAELIAATSGLGFLVEQAGQNLETPLVFVGIIVIGLVGYLMDLGIRALEGLLVPWRGRL